MSWFEYGEQKRSCRKGLALRIRDLPEDVFLEFKKLMRKDEDLDMVFVKVVDKKDSKVTLQGWSRIIGVDPRNRWTVSYIVVEENPEWVCEGDVGRGWKGND